MMEYLVEALQLIYNLALALAWPIVTLLIFWQLRTPLKNLLSNITKLRFPSVEIFPDSIIANAILDRIAHNAHQIITVSSNCCNLLINNEIRENGARMNAKIYAYL